MERTLEELIIEWLADHKTAKEDIQHYIKEKQPELEKEFENKIAGDNCRTTRIAYYSKGENCTHRHVLTIDYSKHQYSYDNIYVAENIGGIIQKVYDLTLKQLKRLQDQVVSWGFTKLDTAE